MNVRQAEIDDADRILDAYEWLFAAPGQVPEGFDPRAAGERLAEAIADPRIAVLIAEDDGELVGFCTTYLTIRSVRFGQRAWVEDLAVDPGHRSRGIGARLLDAARQWAAEQGALTLELESAEGRIDAHRFYEGQTPGWRSIAYGWAVAGSLKP